MCCVVVNLLEFKKEIRGTLHSVSNFVFQSNTISSIRKYSGTDQKYDKRMRSIEKENVETMLDTMKTNRRIDMI